MVAEDIKRANFILEGDIFKTKYTKVQFNICCLDEVFLPRGVFPHIKPNVYIIKTILDRAKISTYLVQWHQIHSERLLKIGKCDFKMYFFHTL